MQNNLRSIRKRKGLTLKDLSRQTGLSIGLIGNFETGERGIGRDALEKVASTLSVQVAEILHVSDGVRADNADSPEECPHCADKDAELARLGADLRAAQADLREARDVIRDQASALAAVLAAKPSPVADHACGVPDGGERKERRGA